jgi:hypothetical protein
MVVLVASSIKATEEGPAEIIINSFLFDEGN